MTRRASVSSQRHGRTTASASDSNTRSRGGFASPTSVTLFAFAAGQELSEHTAPYDALVQVIDGEAAITVAGRPYRVGAGEMILMPAHQPHALKAVSRFKMLLTMIRS